MRERELSRNAESMTVKDRSVRRCWILYACNDRRMVVVVVMLLMRTTTTTKHDQAPALVVVDNPSPVPGRGEKKGRNPGWTGRQRWSNRGAVTGYDYHISSVSVKESGVGGNTIVWAPSRVAEDV